MSPKRLPPEFGESDNDEKNVSGQRALTRRDFVKIASALAGATAVGAGAGSKFFPGVASLSAAGDSLDPPIISCSLTPPSSTSIFVDVCGGASGAPAGFSLQWVKASDYPALVCGGTSQSGWPDDTTLCKASFSGVPDGSRYSLLPGECVTVEVGNLLADTGESTENCGGNPLECSTQYIFRAFAHNVPSGLGKSDFTANLCCSTASCELFLGCVRTLGYWKTHPCEWPAPFTPGAQGTALATQCGLTGDPLEQCACDDTNKITIGNRQYSQCDLLCVLARPSTGNALLILGHQVIAARLNQLSGAQADDCGDVDALIGNRNLLTDYVAAGGKGNILGPAMTTAAACLDLYNNGLASVPHCE